MKLHQLDDLKGLEEGSEGRPTEIIKSGRQIKIYGGDEESGVEWGTPTSQA